MSKNRENISRIKKRKKRSKKKLLFFLIIPLSLLLVATVSYGAHVYNTAQEAANKSFEKVGRDGEKSALRDESVTPIDDNVSVLIIGVDDSETRHEGSGRSDALMLATFNKQEKDVNILSIPRDSYVNVPDYGYTKINHAHAYGGPSKTIDTVESFLNVPVDYYVRLNFEAFIEIVDTIGGIQYDVPFEMSELDSNDNKDAIHLMPGYQNLNGEEALALARTRKYDNDFERGKRQQEIIKTIIKETASASSILKLDELINAVGDNMSTNLTFDEMKSFMSYGLNTDLAINTINIDGQGGKMPDGIWYYQVDEQSRMEVENKLREHLDLPASSETNYEFTQEGNDKEVQDSNSY
ncbi:LCP family protein [Virgibacillus pantothenticus]|uniref:LCP family protein n=1 Tax=Virgibacillus pantothenticus TaxID=1473 RepID=UPI001C22B558|nr:LCP family protein [Virgibacillus pantothenticus]MBU8566626.1 LCP family protein [Virgibacillus pantothenticus]MBU8599118.1 LCP family protein [Virgibacillus pantothenticus]MBU8634783.1 LCP family protein [Virgibacillus pantothenticus]MBU8641134.1 LCP family protein [Virgibacillus pantothenticus]MBU8645212.1 LCP family protein [Virgibacillus pantothenticus]